MLNDLYDNYYIHTYTCTGAHIHTNTYTRAYILGKRDRWAMHGNEISSNDRLHMLNYYIAIDASYDFAI